ncbi:MAG TPA: site-specific DNA-methyltransferase, partial [Thermoleophilaceae bacterium]|nr:site-specific DNA-methyltransferase [Thermoleophilaceae bacterium]
TFAHYCQERWGFSDSRARQLTAAAETVTTVTNDGLPAPRSERVARELVPLKNDETELIEVWRGLRTEFGDDVTADRVKRLVRKRCERLRRERFAEAVEEPVPLLTEGGLRIEHCDIRKLEVEPGSVDLIFTDPPYAKDALDCYDALAEFAARALRPGALVVAYCGNVHAPDCRRRLDKHLEFVVDGAVHVPGPHTPIHHYRARLIVKPLLFYANGRPSPPGSGWWDNFLTSPAPEKQHHRWQQAEADAGRLIRALTEPSGLVCDPFLGSGTTAVVARSLGRRFVGCDSDKAAVNTAKRRLAEPREEAA